MVTVDIAGKLPSRYGRDAAARLVTTAYRVGGGKRPALVSLSVVDDRTMRRLNRAYRGKDKTTDVLSFPFSGDGFPAGGDDGPPTLGEIVVALPRVRRQAKEVGRTVHEEFSLMLVHGTLHLMGYDHETLEDERVMFGLQHEALLQAGVW